MHFSPADDGVSTSQSERTDAAEATTLDTYESYLATRRAREVVEAPSGANKKPIV